MTALVSLVVLLVSVVSVPYFAPTRSQREHWRRTGFRPSMLIADFVVTEGDMGQLPVIPELLTALVAERESPPRPAGADRVSA